ncbi:MAG: hypothetical protein ACR2QK_05675 [Acidimicrobiales bacterium]
MSQEVLWYAARVSGLMTWVLACGALVAGLLLRSQGDDQPSPARLWLGDAHRFLGLASVSFLLVHGLAVVLGPVFDVSPIAAVLARDGSGWLPAGLAIGVLSGWLLVAVEGLRALDAHMPAVRRTITAVTATFVLLSGAAHAWSVGSDVRNRPAVALLAVAAVMVVAAAWLALGTSGLEPLRGGLGRLVGEPETTLVGRHDPTQPAGLSTREASEPAIGRGPAGLPTVEGAPPGRWAMSRTSRHGADTSAGPSGRIEPGQVSRPQAEELIDRSRPFRPEIPLPELRGSRRLERRDTAPIPIIGSARFFGPEPLEGPSDEARFSGNDHEPSQDGGDRPEV